MKNSLDHKQTILCPNIADYVESILQRTRVRKKWGDVSFDRLVPQEIEVSYIVRTSTPQRTDTEKRYRKKRGGATNFNRLGRHKIDIGAVMRITGVIELFTVCSITIFYWTQRA